MDELDISYSWATGAAGYYNEYADAWTNAGEYIAEQFTSALSQSDSSTYAGQYYSRVGVALAKQSDGQYTWWGYVIIP